MGYGTGEGVLVLYGLCRAECSGQMVHQAQLRLTAQRLGQLQDRMDSQAQITQRDIATLLQQGNIALARAKAQKLMREDVKSDLLQTLEMHVGVILGHLNELERRCAWRACSDASSLLTLRRLPLASVTPPAPS